LQTPAQLIGGVWFLLGFGYLAFKTRGFRTELVMPPYRFLLTVPSFGKPC
jgi:hypothetical protein